MFWTLSILHLLQMAEMVYSEANKLMSYITYIVFFSSRLLCGTHIFETTSLNSSNSCSLLIDNKSDCLCIYIYTENFAQSNRLTMPKTCKTLKNYVKLCQNHKGVPVFFFGFAFKRTNLGWILENFAQMCVFTFSTLRSSGRGVKSGSAA